MNNNTFAKQILENPWRNSYWFARMLINTDKYGALGKDEKLITQICTAVKPIIADKSAAEDKRLNIVKNTIKAIFDVRFKKRTGRSDRISLFIEDVFRKFSTLEDVAVFVYTAEKIMLPINIALTAIPNNDREFTEVTAKAYFDELGEKALATVINIWDDTGVEGSLNAERTAVVQGFTHLKRDLSQMPELESNMVLTSFVQEFERRLGQKRKSRAGTSLEDVASFILDYFKIKSESRPEHFQADIEVDKWIKCKDKWLIGISCKRTLRERWKQVSSASSETLSKFKIREVWHLITYDEDLSDDKLTLLGSQRHVFYLRDDSRKLAFARNHPGLKSYVKPMSSFIADIKKAQGI